MANKFIGFLETVGKAIEKGLGFAIKDAPELTALAGLIFPPALAVAPAVTTALTLLQNTIISVEQKYAAAGKQNETGVQKAADVLALAGPAATTLLTTAGVSNVDTTYISNLSNIIVALLNAKAPVPQPA